MEIDATIVGLFEQSGFASKEARVYAALLALGQGDVGRIAQVANVKRTNVYPLLERLKTRGYVSEMSGGKVRTFSPTDPAKVFRQLENNTKLFREMLPFLQAYVARSGARPSIQYFEGKDAVVSVYRDMHHYQNVCFINSIARHTEVFPEEVRYWGTVFESESFRIHARAMHTDTHADHSFIDQVSGPKYEARLFPKGLDFVMDFAIYGENIGISSVTKDPFIVVVESKDLADSMRTIFDLLWSRARRPQTKGVILNS